MKPSPLGRAQDAIVAHGKDRKNTPREDVLLMVESFFQIDKRYQRLAAVRA